MSSHSKLYTSITLPCGKSLKNRIVKAAMEENMAGDNQLPDHNLLSLYRYWAYGGLGMIITGNVMVDRHAMTGPGGVVLEKDTSTERFEQWAKVIGSGGALAIMQINHPGRQVFKAVNKTAVAPSAIPLKLGRYSKQFAAVRAMTCDDIYTVCQHFVDTAVQAQRAGFDGVQVHAAHGYLLSQFLSPLTNQRDDQWGGSLLNRARLLLNIVCQIRARCGRGFAVMVKLNAADFQRGGLSLEDTKDIVLQLNKLAVDVIEVSGGNYEAPAMQGRSNDDQALSKHAYFVEFASQIAGIAEMPVMTTGGIRSAETAQQVLDQGCDLVGLASALAITPNLALKWQKNEQVVADAPHCTWPDKTLASLVTMAMIRRQLRRLGNDLSTQPKPSQLWSLVLDLRHRKKMTRRYHEFLKRERQSNT
ncbi:NADH:flavin oxidoreductase/NADH oxidase family protein [Alteromonas lipotrueiana]|uniref:NADH:flavin oxidoreductase/NADH oxidase family protein n=1 Tax=Alteromonas lipotrueiana TaxID=2803815 RepID=UPI001C472355|nr:NADH:flavin oxidoreductase/NADH oxidase family protein [Alteromonas lipotrueiana]